MNRIWTILLTGLLLSGCFGEDDPRIVKEYVNVPVPVTVVPAPPKIKEPKYETDGMTEEDIENNLGQAVKKLLIGNIQRDNYANLLFKVIEEYRKLSELNPEIEELEHKQEVRGMTKNSLQPLSSNSELVKKQIQREKIIDNIRKLEDDIDAMEKKDYKTDNNINNL